MYPSVCVFTVLEDFVAEEIFTVMDDGLLLSFIGSSSIDMIPKNMARLVYTCMPCRIVGSCQLAQNRLTHTHNCRRTQDVRHIMKKGDGSSRNGQQTV